MARVDDLRNGKFDRHSRQTSLLETLMLINGRLVHIERQQKHILESMNALDLSVREARTTFKMYEGVLRFLHAEYFSFEKKMLENQQNEI